MLKCDDGLRVTGSLAAAVLAADELEKVPIFQSLISHWVSLQLLYLTLDTLQK